jgi:RimJ/RimL family protein N-acetyltransferase
MPERYPPFSREETQMDMNKKHCHRRRNTYWLGRFKKHQQLNKHAELGIAIGDKNYWGKGFGLAEIKEMLLWGFNELELNKIRLRVEEDNKKLSNLINVWAM